ncbi:MAG: hypothetical protein ACPGXX_14340 [Planctomycetaceae bacterium]
MAYDLVIDYAAETGRMWYHTSDGGWVYMDEDTSTSLHRNDASG